MNIPILRIAIFVLYCPVNMAAADWPKRTSERVPLLLCRAYPLPGRLGRCSPGIINQCSRALPPLPNCTRAHSAGGQTNIDCIGHFETDVSAVTAARILHINYQFNTNITSTGELRTFNDKNNILLLIYINFFV